MGGNTRRRGTGERGSATIATGIRGDASINISLTIAAAASPMLMLTVITMAENREIGKEKKAGIETETQTAEGRVRIAGRAIVGTGTPREVVVEVETAGRSGTAGTTGTTGIVETNRTIEIVETVGVVRAL